MIFVFNAGILWTAGFNTRFTDEPLSAMKSLTGVKADSWGMVQAIPRENSTIADSSIPDSFDSETNWPKCAKVQARSLAALGLLLCLPFLPSHL